MAGNIGGISSYQQTNQIWKNNQTNKTEKNTRTDSLAGTKDSSDVKINEWKSVSSSSSLIPTKKDGYGMVVGNVELSDKAKEYYSELKSKFGNMEFIAVSADMKSQAAQNASIYGNASKQVVLIDVDKLEQMANDESYRKKYEGIIAMSQSQLSAAKNSLASTGANITNFGMSVDSNGNTSFFATCEKATTDQTKALLKKQAAKKAAKIKEQKKAEKKEREERIEKRREEAKEIESKKSEDAKKADDSEDSENTSADIEKEYIDFKSNSLDSLIRMVSKYAYNTSANNILTDEETNIGQNIDFRG